MVSVYAYENDELARRTKRVDNDAVTNDFGPFGGTISSSGVKKDDFSFRFSTKYTDQDTGLVCYGYRYCDIRQSLDACSPEIRWTRRGA